MKHNKLITIFLVILFVRIIIAIAIPPGADEAYYYVYSLYPSLSYFDHPPMVSWVGAMIPGLVEWINSLSIRIGPIILFSIAIYIFLLLARKLIKEEESLMAAVIFMLTPMFFLSGTFLLPDAPLICFWIISIYIFKITLEKPVTKNWILLGIAIGLGMLSKYTAGFLYIGGLSFIIIQKKYRKLLLTPGPYLAIITSIICFAPVILWNYNNGFISFLFQTGRVGASGIKLRYFYQSFFGQMGYLLPFFFFPAVYYAGKSVVKLFKENDEYNSMIFSFGALPLLFFFYSSLFKRVLPHWPVIGYITLAIPVGKFYCGLYENRKKLFNIYSYLHILIVLSIVILVILQMHTGILINRELPETGIEKKSGVRDISIDITGWNKLNEYLKNNKEKEDVFLFTHKWYLAGQISFAVKGSHTVLCLNERGTSRGFSFWEDQKKYLGKDGIFISTSKFYRDPVEIYSTYFDQIEPLTAIPVKRRGKLIKIIYLYKCNNFSKIYVH